MRIPFCVASSGPRKKIEENLRTTRLLQHFEEAIFSAYEVGSWKPKPDLFLHAAEHFGVDPGQCIVIEDSYVGVCAGVAANMQVLALDLHGDVESLSAADQVFSSVGEIHEFLVLQDLAVGPEIATEPAPSYA